MCIDADLNKLPKNARLDLTSGLGVTDLYWRGIDDVTDIDFRVLHSGTYNVAEYEEIVNEVKHSVHNIQCVQGKPDCIRGSSSCV
jgi:hypothetical protein